MFALMPRTHLMSCNRSSSIASFLNRTVSFSQLNVVDEEDKGERDRQKESSHSPSISNLEDANDKSLNRSLGNLSRSLSTINTTVSASLHSKLLEEDSQLSMSSGDLYQPMDQDNDSILSPSDHQPKKREGFVHVGPDDSKMEAAKGGYLGRFTNERRGMAVES